MQYQVSVTPKWHSHRSQQPILQVPGIPLRTGRQTEGAPLVTVLQGSLYSRLLQAPLPPASLPPPTHKVPAPTKSCNLKGSFQLQTMSASNQWPNNRKCPRATELSHLPLLYPHLQHSASARLRTNRKVLMWHKNYFKPLGSCTAQVPHGLEAIRVWMARGA